MSERRRELTPEQESRIEHRVDTEGISYADARAKELGLPIEIAPELLTPDNNTEIPLPDPHHRVSEHHVKGGHVRDFADGGRSDEDRKDDFAPSLNDAAQHAYDAKFSEVQETRDDAMKARLLREFGSGAITQAQVAAEWRKHVEGREQRLGTDQADHETED